MMLKIFDARNRFRKLLLLGLFALILYAFYCTTFNDIHPLGATQRGGHRLLIQILHGPSNISSENATLALSSKNSIPEPLDSESDHQRPAHEATGLLSPMFPSVLDGSQQPASFSNTPTDSQSAAGNDTLVVTQPSLKQNNESSSVTITTTTTAATFPSDSAGAIYRFGHDVAVPENCPNSGKDMDLVIMITSAPSHAEARMAIRQTWGHYGHRSDVSVVFILGSTTNSSLEKSLKQEEKLYGDVIRGRYSDSYSNLTLKTISSFEWVNTYCSKVKFVLKTDDDMFINVPRLLTFVKKHNRDKNVIFGRLAVSWKPIRNKKSKYYVSKAQYNATTFPDFTTGPAYLLSRDVCEKLYKSTLEQTYLKLEDVLITGIVAHKLGIKRIHVNDFLNRRIPYAPCKIQRGISIHMVTVKEQFELWKKLLADTTKCKIGTVLGIAKGSR